MSYTDEWFESIYGKRPDNRSLLDLQQELDEAWSRAAHSLENTRQAREADLEAKQLQSKYDKLAIWEAQRQAAMTGYRKACRDHEQPAEAASSYMLAIKDVLKRIVPDHKNMITLSLANEVERRFTLQAARIYLLEQDNDRLQKAVDSANSLLADAGMNTNR